LKFYEVAIDGSYREKSGLEISRRMTNNPESTNDFIGLDKKEACCPFTNVLIKAPCSPAIAGQGIFDCKEVYPVLVRTTRHGGKE